MPIESDTRQPFATQRGRVEEKERNVSHARCRRCANPHACAMKRKKIHPASAPLTVAFDGIIHSASPNQRDPFSIATLSAGKGVSAPLFALTIYIKFIHVRSGAARHFCATGKSGNRCRPRPIRPLVIRFSKGCGLTAAAFDIQTACSLRCAVAAAAEYSARSSYARTREMLDRMTSLRLCSPGAPSDLSAAPSVGRLEISFLNLLTWRTTTLFWLPLFMREWLFAQPLTEKLFRQG